MTDESVPPIPGTPEANDLIVRGSDGDPVRDPRMVAMTERESYERVIEGLKMAADAAEHLARNEPENHGIWRRLASNLDQCRRISVQIAGLGLTIKERQTEEPRGSSSMPWRPARDRFREGCRQAAGGMRQLAICFRNDFAWSKMAKMLESMQAKMTAAAKKKTASLILPEWRQ
jgi:hypothetical protein